MVLPRGDLLAVFCLVLVDAKAEVVDRIVSFLASPDPSESKGPVAKKPKKAAKKVFTCSRFLFGCLFVSFSCIGGVG